MYHKKSFSLPPGIEKEYRFTALLSLHENAIVFTMERKKASAKKPYTGSFHPSSEVLKIIPEAYFDEMLFDSLRSLHHPLLLLPTELLTEQDYVFAIYPKLLPFSDYLCRGEITFSVILQWIRDMDTSVSCLHEKNILHGDIAPGNIYLDEENHFSLGDFSSSVILSPQEKNFSLLREREKTASTFPFPSRATGFQQDIFSFLTLLNHLLKGLTLPGEEEITTLHPLKNEVEDQLSEVTTERHSETSFHQVCQKLLSIIEDNQLEELFSGQTFTLSPQEMDCLKGNTKNVKKNILSSLPLPAFKIPVSLLGLVFCIVLLLSAVAFYASRGNPPAEPALPSREAAATPHSPILDISHKKYQEFPSEIAADSSVNIIFAEDNRLKEFPDFSGFSSLEELYLDNNSIAEIEDISGLESLAILGLSNNQIGDVSALGNLPSLRILDLSYQVGLKNLPSLEKLKRLQYLVLTGTNATDKEIQHLQQAMPSCTILH